MMGFHASKSIAWTAFPVVCWTMEFVPFACCVRELFGTLARLNFAFVGTKYRFHDDDIYGPGDSVPLTLTDAFQDDHFHFRNRFMNAD